MCSDILKSCYIRTKFNGDGGYEKKTKGSFKVYSD